MIDRLVTDLIETSRDRIDQAKPESLDDVRRLDVSLIALGDELGEGQASLKRFLREELYTHPHVEAMTRQAHKTISDLFAAFEQNFDEMPPKHAARAQKALDESGPAAANRAIADYVAGMTDRFALQQHQRITGANTKDAPLLD
jgi:dGTPase